MAYGEPLAADGVMFRGTPPPLWRTDPSPGGHHIFYLKGSVKPRFCLLQLQYPWGHLAWHKAADVIVGQQSHKRVWPYRKPLGVSASCCANASVCAPTGEAQWEGRPCNAKHGAVVTPSGAAAWAFTLTEGAPMLDTWPPLPGAGVVPMV